MKTFNHNKLATATTAMLGVAFFASGAHADEASSVTVRYSDLKPNSTAGAMVLYQRIHTAWAQTGEYPPSVKMWLWRLGQNSWLLSPNSVQRPVDAAPQVQLRAAITSALSLHVYDLMEKSPRVTGTRSPGRVRIIRAA
jgi:hypothetical protein